MTPLEAAILDLTADVEALRASTPEPGTLDWFRLRSMVLGLSYLKRCTTLAADPAAADRIYRAANRTFKEALPLEEVPV